MDDDHAVALAIHVLRDLVIVILIVSPGHLAGRHFARTIAEGDFADRARVEVDELVVLLHVLEVHEYALLVECVAAFAGWEHNDV